MSQNAVLPFPEVLPRAMPGVTLPDAMPGACGHARPLHGVTRWRGMDMRAAGIVRSK
jgi:hypothetical protein